MTGGGAAMEIVVDVDALPEGLIEDEADLKESTERTDAGRLD